MRKRLTAILFAVILAICLPYSEVQAAEEIIWERTGDGIEGGRVLALVIDPQMPSTLYAGTYGGGIFKSADG